MIEEPDATVPTPNVPDATVEPNTGEDEPEGPEDEEPKNGGIPNPEDDNAGGGRGGLPNPEDDNVGGGGRGGGPRVFGSNINYGTGSFIGRDGFPAALGMQPGAAVRATISPNGLVHVADVSNVSIARAQV